ncbi:calmodulin-regulated spectrin-associated protein patronin isoform X8 [Musca autumnalis]|uniref:calmodulin-regulated spectrin-associated protein patronin isoform X8 n=1 Tax=Musca autumnalis TaxID=221902 RepID=UPI003CF640CF
MDETQEIRQARYRASVKWLLSKAYNNRVPDNLKEPFYRDHENQERLKPKIVVDLANATLYCQTLSNLYSDPNYQSLNHWSILQTLARKGVPVNETKDMPLTETVLIQTNPLRIVAHIAVIESLMMLYAKEITSNERVVNAIKRISGNVNAPQAAGNNVEQIILSWVSHTCAALKKRIERDVQTSLDDDSTKRLQSLDIPPVRDFQDLCDGICLALLISYYCPKVISWTEVRINYLPAVEDSIHNVLLVSNFSQKYLPYNVFHMLPEDVTYMRGSMKLNLLILLADLFNLFEIHPANCVTYPGMDSAVTYTNTASGFIHKPAASIHHHQPQPPQQQQQFQQTQQSQIYDPRNMAENAHFDNEAFVVHKSRGVTTLSTMHMQQQQQDPLMPARLRQAKEKSNTETKADERGDNVPAGRPSNWDQHRRPSYAGRRSRRNSSSEDSQLTIENFGGSQDQLNAIDRFDRGDRDRERKLSNTTIEHVVPIRSSIADARGTLQIGYDTDSGSEKQDHDTEKQQPLKRQPSCDNVNLAAKNNGTLSHANSATNVPQQQKQHSNSPEMTDDPREQRDPNATLTRKSSNASMHMKPQQNWQNNTSDLYDDDTRSQESAYKLSNIRMKLEERRRMIEQDKRRIELALNRYQDKLNQDDLMADDYPKWETMSNDSKRTSDIDPMELDRYQQSIAIMNMNLQDIQQDIQRLATQQNQIQAQQMQAQQLLQAQQIANMLNQQHSNFGSQQHLADPYPPRPLQQQQNFGSSPHLPQAFNSSVNPYGSRPPSRDPYQQMQTMPVQYMNDSTPPYNMYGQPQQPSMVPQQSQYNTMHGPPPHYNDNNVVPYNNSSSNHNYGPQPPQSHHPPPQSYIPRQSIYDDYPPQSMMGREPNMSPQPNNYYGHEAPPPNVQPVYAPPPTQRRTWAQPSFDAMQQPMVDVNAWQRRSQKSEDGGPSWGSPQQDNHMTPQAHHRSSIHQNGDMQMYPVHSSPVHSQRGSMGGGGVQRQQSMTNLRETRSPIVVPKASSAPTPPDDVMAPQSICFIGDEDDIEEIERNVIEKMQSTGLSEYSFPIHHNSSQHHQQPQHYQRDEQYNYDDYGGGGGGSSSGGHSDMMPQKLNITSGNLTYRIPSPQRPQLHPNSFQDPRSAEKNNSTAEKGFYISFDDDQPKRPKPPLRAKRSPKKEKSLDSVDHQTLNNADSSSGNLKDFNESSSNYSKEVNEPKFKPKVHQLNYSESSSPKSSAMDINKATYNKYTDSPIQLSQVMSVGDNKNFTTTSSSHNNNNNNSSNHNQPQTPPPSVASTSPTHVVSSSSQALENSRGEKTKSKALIIGTDTTSLDPESVDEMERRKEKIMLMSLQRRQQQEEAKERKEQEAARKRELEREKEEEKQRKKEEQMARRAAILEQHRLKKALEEAEREGKTIDRNDIAPRPSTQTNTISRTRKSNTRPRPKTIHVDDGSAVDISEASSLSSRGKKGSSSNITGLGQLSSNSMRRDYYRGSQDSLTVKESPDEYPSTSSTPIGRRGSYKLSKEPNVERGRTLSRISVAKGSTLNFRGRKSNSLMNLCDSGIGRATPPRRAQSPGISTLHRHMPSPSGPGSLPGFMTKRRGLMDDGSSDMSSTGNLMMDYSGPKLYKQPAAKSNRGIILNAVEYCVFPGAVNRDAKQKVLEKIARSEAKHFLVLFRDAGCQFRALYSYTPETEQVVKLYGTGPSQVDEVMFDKFFKYNSGGKCFSQVHTKHLTVTIDAFTIHNSLWQGKKVNLPSKKDMALVI